MEKNKMISIIIPVYNSLGYLDQCLESIFSQDYKFFEVILVDDGSIDGSAELCDQYGQLPNVEVIHKHNGGAAESRNVGLRKAEGDYVLFVDSDDFITTSQCFTKLVSLFEDHPDCDFIGFNMNYFWNKDCIKPQVSFDETIIQSMIKEEIICGLVSCDAFSVSPCTKLFKKSFLVNEKICFPERMVGEDYIWFLQIVDKAKSFHFENFYLYNYRKSICTSVSGNMTLCKFEDFFRILKFMIDYIPQCSLKENGKNALLSFTAYYYCTLLGEVNYLQKRDKEYYKLELAELKWLFNYDLSRKVKKVKNLIKFLGFNTTSFVLYWYIKNVVRGNMKNVLWHFVNRIK